MKVPFRQLVNDTSPFVEIDTMENIAKELGMKQAFTELYQILNHSNSDVRTRIPNIFFDFLEERCDMDWNGNLDFSKKLLEMNMLSDTKVLISMVYRDFLCSEEERNRLIEREKKAAEAIGSPYEYESLLDLLQLTD